MEKPHLINKPTQKGDHKPFTRRGSRGAHGMQNPAPVLPPLVGFEQVTSPEFLKPMFKTNILSCGNKQAFLIVINLISVL